VLEGAIHVRLWLPIDVCRMDQQIQVQHECNTMKMQMKKMRCANSNESSNSDPKEKEEEDGQVGEEGGNGERILPHGDSFCKMVPPFAIPAPVSTYQVLACEHNIRKRRVTTS